MTIAAATRRGIVGALTGLVLLALALGSGARRFDYSPLRFALSIKSTTGSSR